MTSAVVLHKLIGFAGHTLFVILGLVLMVVGLAFGVSMIMLPVGIVVGLMGFAMVVGGLFGRLDPK